MLGVDLGVADADSGMGGVDLGVDDAGTPPAMTVEVGTGADQFDSVAENQLMPFIQGPQGGGRYEGYHIWGGIKVKGYNPTMATIRLIYSRADNGDEVAYQERVLPLQGVGGGYYLAWGFAPRIHDCCLVLGTELIMRAEIVDQGGQTGFDERHIRTQDMCIDQLSGTSLCP